MTAHTAAALCDETRESAALGLWLGLGVGDAPPPGTVGPVITADAPPEPVAPMPPTAVAAEGAENEPVWAFGSPSWTLSMSAALA